jgi:hypothetical protein
MLFVEFADVRGTTDPRADFEFSMVPEACATGLTPDLELEIRGARLGDGRGYLRDGLVPARAFLE